MHAIEQVFQDPRLQTILGLIFLDLVLGIAVALRNGVFQWDEVARFYKSTVLPVFLGYFAIRATLPYISAALLGDGGNWLTEVAATAFWLAGISSLLSSIVNSAMDLGVAARRNVTLND